MEFTDRRQLAIQDNTINRDFRMGALGKLFYNDTGAMNDVGKALSFIPGAGEVVRATGVLGAKGRDTRGVMRNTRDEMWHKRFATAKLARDLLITAGTGGGSNFIDKGVGSLLGGTKLGAAASGFMSNLPGQISSGLDMARSTSNVVGAVGDISNAVGQDGFRMGENDNPDNYGEAGAAQAEVWNNQQKALNPNYPKQYFMGGTIPGPEDEMMIDSPDNYGEAGTAQAEIWNNQRKAQSKHPGPYPGVSKTDALLNSSMSEELKKTLGIDEKSQNERYYKSVVENADKVMSTFMPLNTDKAPVGKAALSLLNPSTDIFGSAVNLVGANMAYNKAGDKEVNKILTDDRYKSFSGEFNYL